MPSDTIRILSFSRSSDRTYCMPSERSVVFGCAIPPPRQLSVANRQQSHRPRRNPVRPPRMQGATPEKTRPPPPVPPQRSHPDRHFLTAYPGCPPNNYIYRQPARLSDPNAVQRPRNPTSSDAPSRDPSMHGQTPPVADPRAAWPPAAQLRPPAQRSAVFSAPFFPIRRHAVVRNLFHPRKSLREPERSSLSRRSGRIRPSACARSIRRPQRRTSGPPTGNVTTDFNRAARSSSDNGCRHPTCRSAETPVHRSACSDRLVHSSATIRRHLPSAAAAHLRCAALPSRT